jgi:hypothetical protein
VPLNNVYDVSGRPDSFQVGSMGWVMNRDYTGVGQTERLVSTDAVGPMGVRARLGHGQSSSAYGARASGNDGDDKDPLMSLQNIGHKLRRVGRSDQYRYFAA